jgi:hypothetical protein
LPNPPEGSFQHLVLLGGPAGLAKRIILWESNGFGSRVVAKQVLHARGYFLYQVHGENNLGGFLVNDSSNERRVSEIFLYRNALKYLFLYGLLPFVVSSVER